MRRRQKVVLLQSAGGIRAASLHEQLVGRVSPRISPKSKGAVSRALSDPDSSFGLRAVARDEPCPWDVVPRHVHVAAWRRALDAVVRGRKACKCVVGDVEGL